MIVKMIILRLLGSSDDKEKEKIGVARPEGPPLRGFRYPVIRRFSANRWSNGYKTWWPIYTPHPGHLKIAGVPRHLIHIQEHLQAIQELIDHILSL